MKDYNPGLEHQEQENSSSKHVWKLLVVQTKLNKCESKIETINSIEDLKQ
uniref:Uncharacterized protein n=1 Tax=Tetranychus urticae TaxID=32264 RepID=A0A158P585_TETUR